MGMLDNPLWSSLTTLHRPLARTAPGAARFPAEVAPFVAVAEDGTDVSALLSPGESVYFVGPSGRAPGYAATDLGSILQMICERVPSAPDDAGIVELSDRRADVLALAALVYPHYFRPRTPELGRYFGIYAGDQLAAMIGERMGFPGYREISAVCTHPDFVGRGLARRLLAHLGADIAARGDRPFLHVSPNNTRAVALYEQNGYRVRRELAHVALAHPVAAE